ncbi:MAG: hypothetical protein KR126chlam1_00057 [Chlamydiae bacterium]|nr:hypothetical protein [Chlamydiota bacterium]
MFFNHPVQLAKLAEKYPNFNPTPILVCQGMIALAIMVGLFVHVECFARNHPERNRIRNPHIANEAPAPRRNCLLNIFRRCFDYLTE